MAEQFLLASATDKVLIHSIYKSTPAALMPSPHFGQPASALSWAHNNNLIASCGQNDNCLRLFKAADGTLISSLEVCQKGVTVTDCSFSSRSSFIAFGCDDGSFGIYNTRTKQVDVATNAANPAYPIKSIGFNKDTDQYILTACSDGQIQVRSFQQAGQLPDGQPVAAQCTVVFRDRSEQAGVNDAGKQGNLTQAKFSATKKYIIAASYDTGVVLIFDLTPILSTNGSTTGSHNNYLQHKFTGHGGQPCQGIAFSPVNQLLLCSAGFNNKIHFYDIQEGREVKTIDAKAPLTAIAFCSDGHTVAIGTVTGKILLFDLKDAKQPKMELKGHESKKIRCLQFSKLEKKSSPSVNTSAITVKSSNVPPTQVQQKPIQNDADEEIKPTVSHRRSKADRAQATNSEVEKPETKQAIHESQSINTQQSSSAQLQPDLQRARIPVPTYEQPKPSSYIPSTEKVTEPYLAPKVNYERPEIQHVTDMMANVQIPSKADFMKEVLEAEPKRSKDQTKEFNNQFNRQVPKPKEYVEQREPDLDVGDDFEDENEIQQAKGPTSLTPGQRDLICDVFDEKARIYTHDLKSQFNNMHLELIRNFQQQESDLRVQLNIIAGKNYARKLQLKKLRKENNELKQINF